MQNFCCILINNCCIARLMCLIVGLALNTLMCCFCCYEYVWVVWCCCLQCFDTVGWAAEGHPGCKKWDSGGGHWLIRMEWHPAGWSMCLPLLIFPCTIKSRSSLLAPAHPGGPGKRAVKRLWCGGGSLVLLVGWQEGHRACKILQQKS